MKLFAFPAPFVLGSSTSFPIGADAPAPASAESAILGTAPATGPSSLPCVPAPFPLGVKAGGFDLEDDFEDFDLVDFVLDLMADEAV